jgi:hypothetical protein
MVAFEIEFQDPCVKELEDCLKLGPIVSWDEKNTRRRIDEQLVDHIKGLKVTIRSSEHPPPHFHIEHNGEDSSFRIDDGCPIHLSKRLEKNIRNIEKWYVMNKAKLIDKWNSSRPTDHPVGKIVIN